MKTVKTFLIVCLIFLNTNLFSLEQFFFPCPPKNFYTQSIQKELEKNEKNKKFLYSKKKFYENAIFKNQENYYKQKMKFHKTRMQLDKKKIDSITFSDIDIFMNIFALKDISLKKDYIENDNQEILMENGNREKNKEYVEKYAENFVNLKYTINESKQIMQNLSIFNEKNEKSIFNKFFKQSFGICFTLNTEVLRNPQPDDMKEKIVKNYGTDHQNWSANQYWNDKKEEKEYDEKNNPYL